MKKMIATLLAGTLMTGIATAQDAQPKPESGATPAGKQAPATQPAKPMAGDETATQSGDAASTDAATTGTSGTSAAAPTVEAQNAAVAAFTDAQKLQGAGDAAGAATRIAPHMDTIKAMAAAKPDDVNIAGMYGSALLFQANGALTAKDNAGALNYLEASLDPWRKVTQANPTDAAIRTQFVGTLVNVGNLKLQAGNKEAAKQHFEEAIALAQPAYQSAPTDEANANLLLGATIGMNNVTQDPAWFAKVKTLGQELKGKNLLNAANAPAVEAVLAS